MATKKKETPVEAEVVEEIEIDSCVNQGKRNGGSFFWGSVLLILGTFLILENYLTIDLMKYFWPVMLLLFGCLLIYRSFRN